MISTAKPPSAGKDPPAAISNRCMGAETSVNKTDRKASNARLGNWDSGSSGPKCSAKVFRKFRFSKTYYTKQAQMLGKTHLFDFKYGLLNKEVLNHKILYPEVYTCGVGQLRVGRHENHFAVVAYC